MIYYRADNILEMMYLRHLSAMGCGCISLTVLMDLYPISGKHRFDVTIGQSIPYAITRALQGGALHRDRFHLIESIVICMISSSGRFSLNSTFE